jgi:hypothetical protein
MRERHSKKKQRLDRSMLIFVLKGLYKLKGQMVGKIWLVFAGWARVIDRFD